MVVKRLQSVDIETVKELVQLMVDNGLSSISLRNGGEEITLKRPSENGTATVVSIPPAAQAVAGPIVEAPVPTSQADQGDTEAQSDDETLVSIISPMVGTYYSAPNPDAPAFVQVGSKVSPDTVVCIIEAMKVFNEIRAEVSGTIERIVASNQQSIEYGQLLFIVRPD